jgi:uncharacterized protein
MTLIATLDSLALPLCGFVVGGLVGATGVGAGSLMTPMLVLGFGLSPAVAIGTDLLFAAITKTAGTAVHRKLGSIDTPVLRGLLLGSIPAALVVLALMAILPLNTPAVVQGMKKALALLLLATVVAILLRPLLATRWARSSVAAGASLLATNSDPSQGRLLALGAALGAAVAFTSIGAGALGVVALAIVAPLMSTQRIVGTDLAHAIPLTLVCGMGHLALGHTDGRVLALLLAGSLPGVLLGAHFGAKLPETIVRGLLAAVLALAAVMLLVK